MIPKFSVIQEDITVLDVDAIVNSANSSLQKGSGMCKAIYEKAGEERLAAFFPEDSYLEIGSSVVSPAFDLPSKYIIHTVTPKFYLGQENRSELLSSCYASILKAARAYGVKTLAIPCIGAGHHGWPVEDSSIIAVDTLQWLTANEDISSSVSEIIFVCATKWQYMTYKGLLSVRRL